MNPSRRLVVVAVAVAALLAAGPVAADWSAGIELYNQGRFADAAEQFRAVVKSNPGWPGGYLMLGRCQLALEQYGDALYNLRVAAELAPDDPANAATLSRALMALGHHTETRELLEGLDFENLSLAWKAEVARMLARCLLAEGRAADAVALLETRLVDDPDNAAVHRAIARAYQAADDRVAVLDHLARAFALDPDDHVSGRAAATTAMALAAAAGDDGLASSFHDRALELAAELAIAAPEYDHSVLAGTAALGTHQLEIAADWFADAVKDRPQEPEARFYLGRTLATLGRNDEAIAQLRAALGAAPEDELAVRIHDELGRLLACRLELPEAARHFRAGGDGGHADRIDELAAGLHEALGRLATLRSDASELSQLEARLEGLGDADGVAAMARLRKAKGSEIAEIEDNLAEVRAALCQ